MSHETQRQKVLVDAQVGKMSEHSWYASAATNYLRGC